MATNVPPPAPAGSVARSRIASSNQVSDRGNTPPPRNALPGPPGAGTIYGGYSQPEPPNLDEIYNKGAAPESGMGEEEKQQATNRPISTNSADKYGFPDHNEPQTAAPAIPLTSPHGRGQAKEGSAPPAVTPDGMKDPSPGSAKPTVAQAAAGKGK